MKSSAPGMPHDEEGAVWHAIVKGEQRGPLTKSQIEDYLQEGTLKGESQVWRPGFREWVAIKEIDEFWRPPTPTLRKSESIERPPKAEKQTDKEPSGEGRLPSITAPGGTRWSLWKSANYGLIVSAFGLLSKVFMGQSFETASYVQTASAETISSLLGEILALPFLFVIVAVVRNAFLRRLPRSKASRILNAAAFALLLLVIGISLKLYAMHLFSSDANISGEARKLYVQSVQRSCLQKQRSSSENSGISDGQLIKYCDCTANRLADGTTYRELADAPGGSALERLRTRVEEATNSCRI